MGREEKEEKKTSWKNTCNSVSDDTRYVRGEERRVRSGTTSAVVRVVEGKSRTSSPIRQTARIRRIPVCAGF